MVERKEEEEEEEEKKKKKKKKKKEEPSSVFVFDVDPSSTHAMILRAPRIRLHEVLSLCLFPRSNLIKTTTSHQTSASQPPASLELATRHGLTISQPAAGESIWI